MSQRINYYHFKHKKDRKKSDEKTHKNSRQYMNAVCLQKCILFVKLLKRQNLFLLFPNLNIKLECLSTITLLAPSKCVFHLLLQILKSLQCIQNGYKVMRKEDLSN